MSHLNDVLAAMMRAILTTGNISSIWYSDDREPQRLIINSAQIAMDDESRRALEIVQADEYGKRTKMLQESVQRFDP